MKCVIYFFILEVVKLNYVFIVDFNNVIMFILFWSDKIILECYFIKIGVKMLIGRILVIYEVWLFWI